MPLGPSGEEYTLKPNPNLDMVFALKTDLFNAYKYFLLKFSLFKIKNSPIQISHSSNIPAFGEDFITIRFIAKWRGQTKDLGNFQLNNSDYNINEEFVLKDKFNHSHVITNKKTKDSKISSFNGTNAFYFMGAAFTTSRSMDKVTITLTGLEFTVFYDRTVKIVM